MGRLRRLHRDARAFIEEKNVQWESRQSAFSPTALAHFWILVIKSFLRNRCPVRASALAYTTLLSLIPVLAVIVSVTTSLLKSQGDPLVNKMLDQLVKNVAPQLNLVPKETAPGNPGAETTAESEHDARKRVVSEITAYIGKIQSGALGLTGVISLIVIAVLLLSNVEATFNDIWGVTQGRSWFARVVQYWAAITLGPLVLLLAVGLTSGHQFAVAGSSRLSTNDLVNGSALLQKLSAPADPMSQWLWTRFSPEGQKVLSNAATPPAAKQSQLAVELNHLLHSASLYDPTRFKDVSLSTNTVALLSQSPQGKSLVRLNRLLLEDAYPKDLVKSKPPSRLLNRLSFISGTFSLVLPFFFLAAGFGLFYGLMPNTRVQWRAAFAGGLVGGCLWQLNNLLQVLYVSKVVSYSKIYGSLAVVPVFLVGLYFSWLILLFGAQVAYAVQNRQSYLQARQAEAVNQLGREFIAVRIMACVGEVFQRGEPPLSAAALGERLGVPARLIVQIIQVLVSHQILVEVNGVETAYHPGRPLDQITVQDIWHELRASQGIELPTRDDPARGLVREQIDKVRQAESQAASEITLRLLVDRTSKSPAGDSKS